MSTLWTPGGERPVPRSGAGGETGPARPRTQGNGEGGPAGAQVSEAEAAEAIRQLEEAQRHLLAAPVEDVVSNHCYGLFELAAVYLSARPPALDKARLAIDAMGALVEGLEGRLGSHEPEMREALTQIRLAFVQIQKVPEGAGGPEGSPPAGGTEAPVETPAPGGTDTAARTEVEESGGAGEEADAPSPTGSAS